MFRLMCKSKIHRAKVTEVNLHYEGSITLDHRLMEAANILPYEKVQVLNINTGDRAETYAIEGQRGSGDVILNGALARMGQPGDYLIIIAYGIVRDEEARHYKPKIVQVNERNEVVGQ